MYDKIHYHEKAAPNLHLEVRKSDSREGNELPAPENKGEGGPRKLDREEDIDREEFRREKMRRNMAKPGYLNKVAAIDRQNSLLKPRGKGQGLPQELSNEAVVGGMLGKKKRPGSLLRGPGVGGRGKDLMKRLSGLKRDDDEEAKSLIGSQKNRKPNDQQVERLAQARNKVKSSALDRGRGEGHSPGISVLGSFDAESYLSAQRMVGGDKMARFQFNQIASDATPPDRYLKDYRNPL